MQGKKDCKPTWYKNKDSSSLRLKNRLILIPSCFTICKLPSIASPRSKISSKFTHCACHKLDQCLSLLELAQNMSKNKSLHIARNRNFISAISLLELAQNMSKKISLHISHNVNLISAISLLELAQSMSQKLGVHIARRVT